MIQHLIHTQKILEIRPFVQPEECARISEEFDKGEWIDSLVTDKYGSLDHNNVLNHNWRISKTAYHYHQAQAVRDFTADLEVRIASLLGVNVNQFETWQATRYDAGGRFDYHNDCGNWADDPLGGERKYTVLLYLSAPEEGGGTDFRNLQRRIVPSVGLLCIWDNLNENNGCNHQLEHSGMPVIRGEKKTLVSWIRLGEHRK